jgi:hypothetical protein
VDRPPLANIEITDAIAATAPVILPIAIASASATGVGIPEPVASGTAAGVSPVATSAQTADTKDDGPSIMYIDRRVRVDAGKLLSFVTNGEVATVGSTEASLFGSQPPLNDALWAHWSDAGWRTNVFDRTKTRGLEKVVDGSINTYLTAHAATPPPLTEYTTFIVISGDIDMHAGVVYVLEHTAAKVEIRGWEGSVNKLWYQLLSKYPSRVKLVEMKITEYLATSSEWTAKHFVHTEVERSVPTDRDHTVAFVKEDGPFAPDANQAFVAKLHQFGVKCMFYFMWMGQDKFYAIFTDKVTDPAIATAIEAFAKVRPLSSMPFTVLGVSLCCTCALAVRAMHVIIVRGVQYTLSDCRTGGTSERSKQGMGQNSAGMVSIPVDFHARVLIEF